MSTVSAKRRFKLVSRGENRVVRLISDLIKIALMLSFLFPFYWMVITSFKTYNEAILVPPTMWPMTATLDNYKTIFNMGLGIERYAANTVIVTLSIIVLQLIVMVPAAYAFAKYRFRGQGILFGIVLIAFMIPGQVTYIATYLLMANLKLINSLWPQIIPFGANAFGIFMLRQGFRQIPDEVVEAARIDSASEPRIMVSIMLPMCKSSMITIALFSFISHWNAYFWPLVMTSSEKYRPITMLVERVKNSEYGIQWDTIMAANCLLVVPVLIVFVFASRKIIESFAYRGVK